MICRQVNWNLENNWDNAQAKIGARFFTLLGNISIYGNAQNVDIGYSMAEAWVGANDRQLGGDGMLHIIIANPSLCE